MGGQAVRRANKRACCGVWVGTRLSSGPSFFCVRSFYVCQLYKSVGAFVVLLGRSPSSGILPLGRSPFSGIPSLVLYMPVQGGLRYWSVLVSNNHRFWFEFV